MKIRTHLVTPSQSTGLASLLIRWRSHDKKHSLFFKTPATSLSLRTSMAGALLYLPLCFTHIPVAQAQDYGPPSKSTIDCSTGLLKTVSRAVAYSSDVFRNACKNHDYCYRVGSTTYGYSRGYCDSEMLKHMEGICSNQPLGLQTVCSGAAGTYYVGVRELGGDYFRTHTKCYEYDGKPATSAYCMKEHNAHSILAYRSKDDRLQLVYRRPEKWMNADISGRARFTDVNANGVPLARGTPALAYSDSGASVFYTDQNNQINELSWNLWNARWAHLNLSDKAEAPTPGGALFAFSSKHGPKVAYRSTSGEIVDLYYYEGWKTGVVTSRTGAPKAAGDPTGVITQGQYTHLYYRDADNKLNELVHTKDRGWRHVPLARYQSNFDAKGTPSAFEFDGVPRVVTADTNGKIHMLAYHRQRGWQPTDISRITGAPASASDPVAYAYNGTQHIFYRGTDGGIHQLHWNSNDSWSHENLTQLSGASAEATGHIIAEQEPDGVTRVVYKDTSDNMIELYWLASNWNDNSKGWRWSDLTSGAAATSVASLALGSRY